MKVTIELFLLATCIVWNSYALNFEDNKTEVVFTNIIFRHGDRTPIFTYRNDPYQNQDSWPVPFGHLTEMGKDQHRRLGQWLRLKYHHLLGDFYQSQLIHAMSTKMEWTQEAAEFTLQAMFLDTENEIDTIFLYVIPTELDDLLGVRRGCDKYKQELKNILESPQIQELNKANEELYQFLSNHTGEDVKTFMDIPYIYDVLHIQKIHNKTWPDWAQADKTLFDNLKSLMIFRAMLFAKTTEMKRIKSGLLIRQMVRNMNLIAGNKSDERKMNLYSAHDDTIVNMLMALDLFAPHAPTYTATIGIELRWNTFNGYFVTIFYKSLDQEPIYLKLEECDLMCPLQRFTDLMQPLIPGNWEHECDPRYDGPDDQVSFLWRKI